MGWPVSVYYLQGGCKMHVDPKNLQKFNNDNKTTVR
jgi:hypothetical protein